VALSAPRLLIVADLDAAGSEERWLALLRALVTLRGTEGIAVQVRAKGRPPEEFVRLARSARQAGAEGPPLILNGPAELAASLGYDGVHWPEAALPPAIPAAAAPLLRSAAVHSPEAVLRAQSLVHFVVFGPVFPPRSKESSPAGLEALRDVCAASSVPVLAIGGIGPENAAACLRAGAAGVAVVSAVTAAPDPAGAAEALLRAVAEPSDPHR
jgi:thiamine-phosphate diphosphorylase